MKALRVPPMYKCIGLCDADLLDNGTRHPNLVLMKIAGFLFDNHIPFELILDKKANLDRYEHVFMSRVFTFTQLPEFYTKAIGTADEAKFHIGGTGFYANETKVREYRKKREEDFFRLDHDEYLNNGYYGDGEGQVKMCLPLQSVMRTLEKFPEHREELLDYKMAI